MTPGEELRQRIEDFAGNLAQSLPDPAGWGIWLEALLEQLERNGVDERLQGHQ